MRYSLLTLSFLLLLAACSGSPSQARQDFVQAVAYFNGTGVEADPVKGMELLERSAAGGNADAQLMLGYHYLRGTEGKERNPETAMELFLKAANAGNRDAQYNVGLAYVRADGVAKEYEQAFSWFEKAAYQGDVGAYYNLGVMYWNGEGVVKDPLMAYAWFALADEQGYEGADSDIAIARAALTAEQAAEIDRTIASIKAKIKAPESPGANQPL